MQQTEYLPGYSLLSGITNAFAFLPFIALLSYTVVSGGQQLVLMLFALAFLSKMLSEWAFWSYMFPNKLQRLGYQLKNKPHISEVILSDVSAVRGCSEIAIDVILDGVLLYFALKTGLSPALIFLTYGICQAVGSPLQGFILLIINGSGYRFFSMFLTATAIACMLDAAGVIEFTFWGNLLGLNKLDLSTKVLVLVASKSLLSGYAAIGREKIVYRLHTHALEDSKV